MCDSLSYNNDALSFVSPLFRYDSLDFGSGVNSGLFSFFIIRFFGSGVCASFLREPKAIHNLGSVSVSVSVLFGVDFFKPILLVMYFWS